MCSVSMITDDYLKRTGWPSQVPSMPYPTGIPLGITRLEFDALKAEVEALKEELKKARAQDIADNAPDCEMQEKVIIIQKLAEALGIDLEDVFAGHK